MTITTTAHPRNDAPAPASASLTRRHLLRGLGAAAGLTIFWTNHALAQDAVEPTPVVGEPIASPASVPPPERPQAPSAVDAYLRVNPDGTVTLLTGKVEFGQGIMTGFAQIVAEELSLPFERVEVILGQTDVAPYDIGTFGSLSTRQTGPRLWQAAAAMRDWLLELGAEELGHDVSEVELREGAVFVRDDASASVAFADIAAGRAVERELDPDVSLKDPGTFTVIGQPIPRPDVHDKVNGAGIFGIDAAVEGMVYGRVLHPPAFGATLESVDFSAAEAMPGVVGVVHDGDFVALAAERFEQMEAALAEIDATWAPSPSTATHETIFELLVETADEGQSLGDYTDPADPGDVIANLTEPLQLTFRAPYVVHVPIEPRTALVQIGPDRVDVWSSTQGPFMARGAVAEVLDRAPESVVVTPMLAGGAFGAKISPMAEIEAARIAQAVERPVKVIWSRADEFRHAQYRPAMLVQIVTGLDGNGNIAAWQYDLYSAAYFPEGGKAAEGAAADWSADILEIYDVVAAKTMWYQGHSPLPPFFWRVNGATTNTFAREVAMDVLAERAGLDPVTFRRNHLGNNERMRAVMDAAVEKAGWGPDVGRTGQGIGLALGFDANTYVAEVAHVEVNEASGEIRVKHVDVAIDCGLVLNPEAVRHQVEGSVVMSTSATLREMVTFANGAVTTTAFAEYLPLTMREAPTVDVVFVEDKTNPMGGVGEPAVAPLTGAVANAVFDATGIRLAEVPFTPERVLAALRER